MFKQLLLKCPLMFTNIYWEKAVNLLSTFMSNWLINVNHVLVYKDEYSIE